MAGKWRDHEIVKQAIDQCVGYLREQMAIILSWELNTWADGRKQLESPIEVAFYMWWVSEKAALNHDLKLFPQREVEVWDGSAICKYRIDFVVEAIDPLFDILCDSLKCKPLVAIELDGHEFHERTKEQVAARNQRDRALQMAGWKVFHVSGSELYRNGAKTVRDLVSATSPEFDRVKSRIVKELTGQDVQIG